MDWKPKFEDNFCDGYLAKRIKNENDVARIELFIDQVVKETAREIAKNIVDRKTIFTANGAQLVNKHAIYEWIKNKYKLEE